MFVNSGFADSFFVFVKSSINKFLQISNKMYLF